VGITNADEKVRLKRMKKKKVRNHIEAFFFGF